MPGVQLPAFTPKRRAWNKGRLKGAGFCHPVTLAGANPAGKKVPLTLPVWAIGR